MSIAIIAAAIAVFTAIGAGIGIGIATAGVILVVPTNLKKTHKPPADRRVRARGIACRIRRYPNTATATATAAEVASISPTQHRRPARIRSIRPAP